MARSREDTKDSEDQLKKLGQNGNVSGGDSLISNAVKKCEHSIQNEKNTVQKIEAEINRNIRQHSDKAEEMERLKSDSQNNERNHKLAQQKLEKLESEINAY